MRLAGAFLAIVLSLSGFAAVSSAGAAASTADETARVQARWNELLQEISTLEGQPALGAAPAAGEGRRVALVIGNDAYDNLPVLNKALGDAHAISTALAGLGFAVTALENLGRDGFDDALHAFYETLGQGDVVFFFYAGHGVQASGVNYLLPVDMPKLAAGENPRLERNAVDAGAIVAGITARGAQIALVVLDACRDDPFPQHEARGATAFAGLARMEPRQGTFIIYSAGTGQTALDRLGADDADPNSVFTRKFMPILTTPGLPLIEIANRTRVEVRELASKVSHVQNPAFYDETAASFWLRRPQPRLYGIAIGIDEYAGVRRLRGAVNDARLVASALREAGAAEVVEIVDRDARPAYVDYVWRSLVEKASPGDTVVFAYAGASFRAIPAGGSTEADGLDEYLMLADADWSVLERGTVIADDDAGALRDDVVTGWMELAAAKNLNVVFLVDGCHGGGMLDRDFANISFIGASAEDEVVLEYRIDGEYHGAMSVAFADAVTGGADYNGDGFVSQEELFKALRADLFSRVRFEQTPEFFPAVADAVGSLALFSLATHAAR